MTTEGDDGAVMIKMMTMTTMMTTTMMTMMMTMMMMILKLDTKRSKHLRKNQHLNDHIKIEFNIQHYLQIILQSNNSSPPMDLLEIHPSIAFKLLLRGLFHDTSLSPLNSLICVINQV